MLTNLPIGAGETCTYVFVYMFAYIYKHNCKYIHIYIHLYVSKWNTRPVLEQECVHVEVKLDKAKEAIKANTTSGGEDEKTPTDKPPKAIGGAKVDTGPKVAGAKVDTTPKVAAIGAGGGEGADAGGGGGGENATAQAEEEAHNLKMNACPPGHFSGSGQKPCEPCPAGAYMPNAGPRNTLIPQPWTQPSSLNPEP